MSRAPYPADEAERLARESAAVQRHVGERRVRPQLQVGDEGRVRRRPGVEQDAAHAVAEDLGAAPGQGA